MSMPLAALIFDVDGTLAETERDGHRVAFNRAFADFGLDWRWSEDEYGRLLAVTGGKERMRAYWRERDANAADAPGADGFIQALQARKTEHYISIVESGEIGLRPGVAEFIDEARASGVRLAIATTTTPANVDALLMATLGPTSPRWFECIGAGDIVPAKKPAPDIYHWVLERMQLDAAACVAVEDSAAGLAAALGAGIATLVTRSVYTHAQNFTGAFAIVDSLDALPIPRLSTIETWRAPS